MKKQVDKLLICNSNMFVPTVLSEVLGHPDEHYLVISDTKSITKFFEFLEIGNVDYIEYGWTEGRFGFIKKKHELYRKIQDYIIDEIVFFHTEWGEMVNWLIKKLSKTIPVKYCKIYDPIPVPRSKNFKKILKIKLQQKIWWGMSVDVLEHSYAFPSLPESFYRQIRSATIQIPVEHQLVNEYVSEKLGGLNLNADNVLLTGTIVADGLAEDSFYTELTNKVIETVGTGNLVSKCHPRFMELYGKEQDLPQVPSYIPGNVLIDNYKCFIGYESTLLVEAAAAGKKSISLLYLLLLSDDVKNRQIALLNSRLQGKGQILFPKTFGELKELVAVKTYEK